MNWTGLNFTWRSPGDHLVFTCHLPDLQTINWPSPDPYLTIISSIQLKKSYLVGGWWVDQPITDSISGSSFDVSFHGSSFDILFHIWPWAWQLFLAKKGLLQKCTSKNHTVYNDSFFHLLTAYDSLKQTITTYNIFWQLMTAFDNFWQLMTVNNN